MQMVKYDELLNVNKICEIVTDKLSAYNTIVALVLIGSCARGEETYYTNPQGRLCLYSDIEFFVVLRNMDEMSKIQADITCINNELQLVSDSPIFEVSVGYLFMSSIKRVDRRFIIFETKERGKVIMGDPNILNHLPNVTVNSLNKSNLASIINQRLYHVLTEWIKLDEHEKKYCIARNSLDIGTVYLTFSGSIISSYKARNNYLNKASDLTSKVFSIGFLRRINDYLTMKMDFCSQLYSNYDANVMLKDFCTDIEQLLEYLKSVNGDCFYKDYHRLFKAIAHFKFNEVRFELSRPKQEHYLCDIMIESLKNGAWNSGTVSKANELMNELYKKR